MPLPEQREFRSPEEIDTAIAELRRRIPELEQLDCAEAALKETGADEIVASNVRETMRDIFGSNSPEFREHKKIRIWVGTMSYDMSHLEMISRTERGRQYVIGILKTAR